MTIFNRIIFKFRQYLRKLDANKPTELPIGRVEFDLWAADVLSLTRLPDNDSTRFALASTIPHQEITKGKLPKAYFAGLLMKSAANQVAFSVMEELKEKQQAAIDAAKQAEATAQDAPDVTPPSALQPEV